MGDALKEKIGKISEVIDILKPLAEDLKEILGDLRAITDRKEVENNILERVAPWVRQDHLTIDELTTEELREGVLPEHAFSHFYICLEFTSELGRQYRAKVISKGMIILAGFDKDYKALKRVAETLARETRGKLMRLPQDMRIRVNLPSALTQSEASDLVEKIREHFSDVRIARAYFRSILTGFKETIPEKYLTRERLRVGRKIALTLLAGLDYDLKRMDEVGVEKLKDDWEEVSVAADEPGTPPLWICKLWRSNWDDKEAKMKMRKMRELYKQVLEELGFIQPGVDEYSLDEYRKDWLSGGRA